MTNEYRELIDSAELIKSTAKDYDLSCGIVEAEYKKVDGDILALHKNLEEMLKQERVYHDNK